MNDYDEQDELGRNVTHLFKSDLSDSVAVVSVRLDHSEVARLEKIGRETGKTVFQVIQDAIAAYQVEEPTAPVQR